jgi:hypothetical protein
MKATKAQIQIRVEEILRIRLDGAQIWDVREFVREQEQTEGSPWQLADGCKPLSDSQLWRYMARADKQIAESCRASRKKLLRRHLAQRRNIFGKAMSAGDYRAALAALRDEAELLGLYLSTKVTHGVTNAGAARTDEEMETGIAFILQRAMARADAALGTPPEQPQPEQPQQEAPASAKATKEDSP